MYVALVTFGMSETIPATTKAIVSLSEKAGVDPRYGLALYSAVTGAFTGGIGWGVGAVISGALTSGATSLAMDTGTGRHITQKVAKEFFMDVVGMSPQAAYTAASITVSTGVSIAISLGAQTAQAAYKKFVGYDVTWEKGGAAVPKKPFDAPRLQNNNVGVASKNFNPNSPWDQLVKEGGIMSRTVNKVAGMNAFAGLHDQLMLRVGMASGPVNGLTVGALNFPTMPPAAAMTYGALMAPNSVAAGGLTAINAGISSYRVEEQGGADESY